MAANSVTNARYLKFAYTTSATLNVTEMVWAYQPSVVAQKRGLIDQIYNSVYGPTAYLDASDGRTITFDINTATSPVLMTVQAPVAQWFNVAIVVASSSTSNHVVNCYVNGQIVATQLNTETFGSSNSSGFAIPNETNATQGYLRDARIWDRALTGTEVALEFASFGGPVHRQGLILAAPLDLSVSKNNAGAALTAVGGTTAFVGLGGSKFNRRKPVRGRL